MKKRILSALLVFCLACSLVGTAWAADGLPTAAPTATPDVSNVVTPDEPEDTTEGETSNPATQSEGEGETDPTEAPADPTATPTATPEPSESPAPAATPDAEQPEVTPTPVPEETETPAPEPTAEATEAPAEPEPTAAPTATPNGVVLEDGSVEYTAVLTEGEDEAAPALNVVVTAPAGAFDEGVNPTLSVSAIEDENDLNDIEDELEGEVEYDGFAALDIRFVDADGNEIEPNEGSSVKVRIELPDSIVDSGIDLSTLAVQHLAEDEAGNVTAVDPVASVADGTIALSAEAQAAMEQAAADANAAAGIAPMSNAPAANNALTDATEAAAVAEFEVSGFSTFTITWDTGDGWVISGKSVELDVTCYTTDGEQLPNGSKPKNISLDNGETVYFNAKNNDLVIENYTFDHAEIGNGTRLESIRAVGTKEYAAIFAWYEWQYYINDSRQGISNAPSIRLYYTKNEEPEPGPGGDEGGGGEDNPGTAPDRTLTNNKVVEYNEENDTYDLTLTVSGAVSSEQGNNLVDVIFVLDRSKSMQRSIYNNNDGDAGENRRMNYAKNAIETMATSLSTTDGIDARFALVTFHSKAEIETFNSENWSTNAQQFNGVVASQDYVSNGNYYNKLGGTNYEAALDEVIALQNSVRDNARLVVVFVSDGDPTYYYDDWGNIEGDGSSFDGDAMDQAQIKMSQLNKVNTFFTVGVGPQSVYTHLADLTDETDYPYYWENGHRKQYQLPNGMEEPQNKVGNSPESLKNAFDDMAAQITNILCDHVSVVDTLSNYVDVVTDSSGKPLKLLITVTDEEGKTVKESDSGSITMDATTTNPENIDRTITAKYEGGQLKLVFPDLYKLEPGYTYAITTTIKANENAYKYYRDNGNKYIDKGEEGTGVTSAGQDGIPSNSDAEVSYTFDDEELSQPYKKPVIQIHPKTLTITKKVTGVAWMELDNYTQESYAEQLKFELKLNDGMAETIPLSEFEYSSETGTYTFTYNGLSPETSYTVAEVETAVNIPDYEKDVESSITPTNQTGKLPTSLDKENNVTVAYTNAYKKSVPDNVVLTIDKQICGLMGDTTSTEPFTFKLMLSDSAESEKFVSSDKGGLTYQINEGQSQTINFTAGTGDELGGYIIQIAANQTATIEVPYGVYVSIVETERDGYEAYYRVGEFQADSSTVDNNSAAGLEAQGFINGNTVPASELYMTDDKNVCYRNFRDVVPPTGLESNHTAPYTLIITAAGLAGLALIGSVAARRVRRRREE